MTTVDEFDRLIELGRKRVMAVYAFESQEREKITPAQSAAALTQRAIDYGFVGQRRPLTGENLRLWTDKHYASVKVPLWAVLTAVTVLVEDYQWVPDGQIQWSMWGLVWYRRFGSIEQAFSEVPGYLTPYKEEVLDMLSAAHASRQSFEARRQ